MSMWRILVASYLLGMMIMIAGLAVLGFYGTDLVWNLGAGISGVSGFILIGYGIVSILRYGDPFTLFDESA